MYQNLWHLICSLDVNTTYFFELLVHVSYPVKCYSTSRIIFDRPQPFTKGHRTFTLNSGEKVQHLKQTSS